MRVSMGMKKMTDQEKMLEFIKIAGEAQSQDKQIIHDNAAREMKMMYDSYIKAGFTKKQAFNLLVSIATTGIARLK